LLLFHDSLDWLLIYRLVETLAGVAVAGIVARIVAWIVAWIVADAVDVANAVGAGAGLGNRRSMALQIDRILQNVATLFTNAQHSKLGVLVGALRADPARNRHGIFGSWPSSQLWII